MTYNQFLPLQQEQIFAIHQEIRSETTKRCNLPRVLMNAPPRHVSPRVETFVCGSLIVKTDMMNNDYFNIWEVFGDSWDQPVNRAETPFTGYLSAHDSYYQPPTSIGQDLAFGQNIGNSQSTISHRNQSSYSSDAASRNLHENLHTQDQTMLFDNEANWTNNATWMESPQFRATPDLSKFFPQQHLDKVDYLGAHGAPTIPSTSFSSSNGMSIANQFSSWGSSLNDAQTPFFPSATSYPQDGLPRMAQTSPWTANSDLSAEWTQATAAPATISPRALTISKSSAAMSSSGSSQGSEVALSSDESPLLSASMLEPEPAINTIVQRPQYRGAQHIPPRSAPLPSPVILPSNIAEKPKAHSDRTLLPKPIGAPMEQKNTSFTAPQQTRTLHRAAKRIEPKPVTSAPTTDSEMDSDRVSAIPCKSANDKSIHRRESKDAFLVRSKLAGMSYKDIRREGGFTEAESTLRGRYRTLTKDKAERVRKPEWEDNDIRLLKKAVRKYIRMTPSSSGKSKIPWKQVADYIYEKGGSYHFGNATCRKKYDELMARSPR